MSTAAPVAPDELMAVPVQPLKLRVLDGRLAGAEHRLPDGGAVRVGHAFENDIVLRGQATRNLSVELHRDGPSILLKVLSGEVILLGRALSQGEEALLPGYLPVRMGDYAFAVGGDNPERWEEAAVSARQVARAVGPADEQPRAPLVERAATRFDPLTHRVGRVAARPMRLVWLTLALVALIGAALFAVNAFTLDTSDPVAVEQVLARGGFSGLSVRSDAGGPGVIITGEVKDDAALAKLKGLVDARAPDARLEVGSTEAMAAAATDLLAGQGIDATARVARAGVLLVNGEYLPSDRQAQVAQLIRSDVPGVRAVEFRADPAKGGDALRYFFNSPEYGAASFVDGDPGYLVTADGSRWFTGAVLPTGHRIVSVGAGRLTVEKDGRVEAVVM